MIKVALASLLGRTVRLLMSTFAIVLGVAFVVGTLIFSDTLDRSFTSLFASSVGDVVVRPAGAQNAQDAASSLTVPADVVDRLSSLPGVARVDGNVDAEGVYVVDTDGKAVGGFGPPALGGNYTDAPAADDDGLTLMAGHAPHGSDQVVLDVDTAERAGYQVGDTVPVLTPEGKGRLRPALVGLVGYPDGGTLKGATLVLFDTATAQRLFLHDHDAFSNLWVTADAGVSEEQLAATVRSALPPGQEALTGDQAATENAGDLKDALGFLTTFLLIFGGIALVVGSFLIVNTFSMLVAQRSRELALLRALGASRRQVVRSVQLEAFVLGVLGSTLGLGLGVLLAIGLRAIFARFGLDLSGTSLVYEPRTFVVAYAVGIAVTMAAAYLPARRSARIAPVQAMRDDVALPEASLRARFVRGLVGALLGVAALVVGLDDVVHVPHSGWYVGAGVLAILLGVVAMSPVLSRPFLTGAAALFRRLFGTVGRLAGQNSLRNPRRTTATASALMIGLTLASTMAIIGASAKASIDDKIGTDFVGDFVVTSVFGGTFSPSVAREMAGVEGVEQVFETQSQIVRTDEGRVRVNALDPGSFAGLGLGQAGSGSSGIAGGLSLPEGAVLLTQSFADDVGLGAGDRLGVSVPRGHRDWTVVGVVPDNGLLRGSVITGPPTLRAAGFTTVADSMVVVVAEPGATGLQQRLDAVVKDQPIVTVQDEAAFAAQQRAPVDRFVRIIYALLALALLIAVLGIVNTLALSVIERTREVGLLRAVGVSRAQLRRMITLESVTISLLGAVLGDLLGLGFGVALMRAVRDEGLEIIAVPWGQLVVFLVLSILIGVVAAVFPARRAARLDVLRAISTE